MSTADISNWGFTPAFRQAVLVCGFDEPVGQGGHIFGTEGHIPLSLPFHPAEDSEFTVYNESDERLFSFNTGTRSFTPAIEHFERMCARRRAAGTLNLIKVVLESSRRDSA